MAEHKQRIVGLISGTSVDGIDAALVDISGTGFNLQVELIAAKTVAYEPELRQQILSVCEGASLSMPDLAALDCAIATAFANAAQQVQRHQAPATLIASHGQTVYHQPPVLSTRGELQQLGYSLQLGSGAAIAYQTGITTINNFRAADLAAGGQGAPLVPPIDVALFSHPTQHRCIQNVGGIGNLTYIPAWDKTRSQTVPNILGWDTGPGNALIDMAVQHFSDGAQQFDQDGAWGASGLPCTELVDRWLQQPYFQQIPPKSTGRELFSRAYLDRCLADCQMYQLSPADCIATLTELTAASIAASYRQFLPRLPDQVLLCGGGSRNRYLISRLQHHLNSAQVMTTDDVGISSDFKEAIAFAVLGFWRNTQFPGNLPTVTGAQQAVLLGDIHQPPNVQPPYQRSVADLWAS
ncbi:MAG: anhydro-N-acetylmuramic acid kinase [Thainema sp.]